MGGYSEPGKVVDGRFLISNLLGKGSMAEVYSAYDQTRHTDVAVKIIRHDLAKDDESSSRLHREVRALEMIAHPNVARLQGGGLTSCGASYLVMELLRGYSLRHMLRRRARVPIKEAVDYCIQALKGLAAAHQVGVLHRDLKPANLMLESEANGECRIVLIDFGFATLEGSESLTMNGHVVGSLAYLAPERLRGEKAIEASDLYSIGVILYELVVGTRPFVAKSDLGLMNMHLDAEPVPPSKIAPDAKIPEAVEGVIMQALAKDPSKRAKSAHHMANDLLYALGQE